MRKERVARWSVVASFVLTVGKLAAGMASGSLALMSEAIHSLVDTAATLVTWFAVRASSKPADAEHHYGHGKFESVAALVETGVLFALAIGVLIRAIRQLFTGGGYVEATPLVFIVIIVSIIIDIKRIRALGKVARDTGSQALAADALHFASDLAGSAMVLLGMIASVYGFKYGDAFAAVGVAVFIGLAGWRLGRRTLDTLLDTAPKERVARVREIVAAVPGVLGVGDLRLRPGGNEVFGELELDMSRILPLEQAAAIKERVAADIRAEYPDTVLTITMRPRAMDSESVRERVYAIAQRRQLPVHHVTVQDLGGRLSISLDMEVDGRMSLGDAHEVAEAFKAALREEFGPETEVEPHIEPLELNHLSGRDAPADTVAHLSALLATEAAKSGKVRDVHNVRVRETRDGFVVNYHCRVEPTLDVTAVHALVDTIEHGVRAACPDILRIVGHTDLPKVRA